MRSKVGMVPRLGVSDDRLKATRRRLVLITQRVPLVLMLMNFMMVTLAALLFPGRHHADGASPYVVWPLTLFYAALGIFAIVSLVRFHFGVIPPSVPPSGSRNPLYYN